MNSQLNSDFKSEANIILHDLGLLSVLSRYGAPTPVGSYSMDLMTWADLDLYLICDAPNVPAFFDLGKEIAACLKPQKMTLDNNLDRRIDSLPEGLYWGTRTCYRLPRLWKIDLWCIDPAEAESLTRFQKDLLSRITPDHRRAILEIKSRFCSHPRYRSAFSSLDIYNAVLDNGIRTSAEFEQVLARRGIECP